MNSPEKYWFDRLGFGSVHEELKMRKCKECDVYSCEHIRKAEFKGHSTIIEPKSNSTISTGEPIASVINDSTPSGEIMNVVTENTKTPQRFIKCNICDNDVLVGLLAKHLKHHIDDAEIVKVSGSSSVNTDTKKETALIGPMPMKRAEELNKQESTQPRIADPKLCSKERYKFRNIENVSAVACTSSNGRYSDFTTTFWLKDKLSAMTSYYAGGSSSTTYKEHERLVVNVVYDSLEDYYALSIKIMKRGGYSSWDQEEVVPDHICEQHELWDTIRKAMVWMSISPKGAMKYFLKLFNQQWEIKYNSSGKAITSHTANVPALNEKLNKQG